MRALETRIPPPVVALTLGALAWVAGGPGFDFPGRAAATFLAAASGLGIELAAALAFLRRRTTLLPWAPQRTQALVTSGLFGFSRNPMYVGQALLLVAWTLHLGAWAGLAAVPAYVLYMNRFQIGPEERILAAKFGADYDAYRARVRRWL
ncbi:MAG: isoprenylcysteine carboxylmethyltransferase family protein [Azospirillum sp.]|nr:isoprenylcysteine carboxylmethyltransferase family protein [Azospirillum sp.]